MRKPPVSINPALPPVKKPENSENAAEAKAKNREKGRLAQRSANDAMRRTDLAREQDVIEMMALLSTGAAKTKKAAAEMVVQRRIERAYEIAISQGLSEEEAREVSQGAKISAHRLYVDITAREQEMARIAAAGVAHSMDKGIKRIEMLIDRNQSRRDLSDKLIKLAFPEPLLKPGNQFIATPEHFKLLSEDRANDQALVKLLREELLWRTAAAARARNIGEEASFLQVMLETSNAEEAEARFAEIMARELENIASAHQIMLGSEHASVGRAALAGTKLRLDSLRHAFEGRRRTNEIDLVEVKIIEASVEEGAVDEKA